MDAPEHPRVFRSNLGGGWRPITFGRLGSIERMSELAQWERDTLFPKYGLPHGIALVESYGSLKSVHYESLLVIARSYARPQSDGSRPLPAGSTLRLLGTRYSMLPETYEPGARDKLFAEKVQTEEPLGLGATLWKMKSPFPRAWIVYDVETLPPLSSRLDLDAIDTRSTDVLFPADPRTRVRMTRDLRATAVVESDEIIVLDSASSSAAQPIPPEKESCEIVSSEPTRVEIEVAHSRPGLVVLGDTYAPGWVAHLRSADVDQAVSQKVRIHRTNRVFRGVVVPAGRHVLTFEYRPTSLYRGAAISVFSWLVLGLLIVIGVRRKNKGVVSGRH